jgi:MarR family transcriptional regulator, organic hydroperoxide resistance regulator
MSIKSQGGFLVSKIHRLSGVIFNRLLKEYNIEINSAQGRIMFVLWEKDGVSIMELAQRTSLQKSTLTSMLDRLESNGYIKRSHSEKDRREILIYRTNKDKQFQNEYQKVSKEMTDLYYKGFSEKEIVDFEKYLQRIYDNLNNNQ